MAQNKPLRAKSLPQFPQTCFAIFAFQRGKDNVLCCEEQITALKENLIFKQYVIIAFDPKCANL
jgi:hypothetical protein